MASVGGRVEATVRQLITDGGRGVETLRVHKLRSLLTMLGMIFGVAAVVSMMSIGAGAQREVLTLIEQLGVRNLIVEAKEATDFQAYQKVRKTSPGLTERDLRVIRANVPGISASTARKRYVPQKLIPKPQREMPQVYGVEPGYRNIAGLRVASGRFFDEQEARLAAPVCVLGEGARTALFGAKNPIGEYVKVNEQWFRVIGTVGPQVSANTDIPGVPAQDRQQPDVHSGRLRYPAARRQLQPIQGRDRRHLPAARLRNRRGRHGRRRPRNPRCGASEHRRLRPRRAGAAARGAAPHPADLRDRDGGARVHLAARRRASAS